MDELDIDGIVAALSLSEKVSLTAGVSLWSTQAVERLGVPRLRFNDGPHGVRRPPPGPEQIGAGGALPATCFPPAVALGSSWDPDLLRRIGAALGHEARALGVHVLLGPGINIKRSPLCGRNFEYLAEDPLLSGTLGAALVDGIQSAGVGASLKHYAANNQETDRLRVSADVDERTLREIYLAGFELAVRTAHPWTVMCSYNRVNGVYASQHEWLLTQVLRHEWGFDGLVVSDWGAVYDRVEALRAGLDLEMPTSGPGTNARVLREVQEGRLPEAVVDRAARRLLALIARAVPARGTDGAAAPSDGNGSAADGYVDHGGEHHGLAREAAGQCAVLLRNDGTLPLRPDDRVAVIGELARTPRYQGSGSSRVVPTRLESALTEIERLMGRAPDFAAGYHLDGAGPDADLEAEAAQVAGQASVAVVFLGLPEAEESEGFDRTHMDLPANQLALLERLVETGTPVVVVLSNGGALRVSGWHDRVNALLEGWLLGQAGGGALADILFGVVNPSGRLAESIPVRLEDTPAYLNFPGELGHVRYGEGVFVGYRYYDSTDRPVSYPFGHGLSYTTFAYRDLRSVPSGAGEDFQVQVTARITNTGDRPGREVVQVYVRPPAATVRRPAHELRGFQKVALAPGETATVDFALGWRDFAYFHEGDRRWVIEGGPATIELGASSRDIRLSAPLEVQAEPRPVIITVDSSLAEWASVAAGRRALERAMQAARDRGAPGMPLLSDQILKSIGSVPLMRLARFPGSALDPERLPQMAEEVNAS